jgi:hypothetical protein
MVLSARMPGLLRGIWRWLFPIETLEGLTRPRRVRIWVRVTTPNSIVSPLTGARAAAFVWRFMVHQSEDDDPLARHRLIDGPLNPSSERFIRIADETWGNGLVLDSKWGSIEVPKTSLDLRVANMKDQGPFLDRPLPPELVNVRQRLDESRLPAHYLEIAISHGDTLQLTACVERVRRSVDAYRDASGSECAYRVRADLGQVRLDDYSTLE